jgi:hypothetical protein
MIGRKRGKVGDEKWVIEQLDMTRFVVYLEARLFAIGLEF